ncbi:MAG: response regulator, partial [Spirochaetota bacterium]|nr:response regulator [Spirochaetota bacterium]
MSQTKRNQASILIVDDTPKNIQVLGSILENEGYEVSLSTNGKMAIEAANKIVPDLILLDIVMPEMDGYEAC